MILFASQSVPLDAVPSKLKYVVDASVYLVINSSLPPSPPFLSLSSFLPPLSSSPFSLLLPLLLSLPSPPLLSLSSSPFSQSSAERCVDTLVELIQTKVTYVVQEAIVVIKVSEYTGNCQIY